MKTKIQIKSIFGYVKFEHECEYNSIKLTLIEALKRGADLNDADLRDANLRDANLSGADLSGADLIDANLRCANLSGADLSGANLRDVDLSGAYLSGANLSGANLRCAYLSGAYLRDANLRDADLSGADLRGANLRGAYLSGANLPIFCKWSFSLKSDKIVIGCKEKTIEEWDLFFKSDEEFSTKRNTEEFKQIEAVYLACKAYYRHLNKLNK